MLSIKAKPYHLLLLLAVVCIALSFVFYNETFDIHLHDSYIVVLTRQLYWVLTLLFFLLWSLNKWLHAFFVSKKLMWFHTILLLAGAVLLIIFFVPDHITGMAGMPRRYYDSGNFLQLIRHQFNYFYICLASLAAGFVLLCIHAVMGLSKKKATQH